MIDDWKNDMLETAPPPPIDEDLLPRSIKELRDGTAPPQPNAGAARKRRITQMEADDVALAEFIVGLDRYIDHAATADVGPVVGSYMAKFVGAERARLVAKQAKLREELAYLRAIS